MCGQVCLATAGSGNISNAIAAFLSKVSQEGNSPYRSPSDSSGMKKEKLEAIEKLKLNIRAA